MSFSEGEFDHYNDPLIPSEESDREDNCPVDPYDNTRPPEFILITENIYVGEEPLKSKKDKKTKRLLCDCEFDPVVDDSSLACGDNCLNRMMLIECTSKCKLGEFCTNKQFQLAQYVPCEVFRTKMKGWGLRATAKILSGTFIMEYCGEVCSLTEFGIRKRKYEQEQRRHYYFMTLSSDEILDATKMGNWSRFINHSCSPKAETQKWNVNGPLRVGFFACKDIEIGEEVTFDYQYERFPSSRLQKCFCGSRNCRGYLGAPKEGKPESVHKVKASNNLKKKPDTSANSNTSIISEDNSEEKASCLNSDNNIDNSVANLSLVKSSNAIVKEKGMNSAKHPIILPKAKTAPLQIDSSPSKNEDQIFEDKLAKIFGKENTIMGAQIVNVIKLMEKTTNILHRQKMLQALANSSKQALKKFVSVLGLPILCSWMQEAPSIALVLREACLKVLTQIPITYKVLQDEPKLMRIVEEWSKGKSDPTSESSVTTTTEGVINCSSVSPDVSSTKTEGVMGVTSSTECSNNTVEAGQETQKFQGVTKEQVQSQSANLQEKWSKLCTYYKAPKKEKPNVDQIVVVQKPVASSNSSISNNNNNNNFKTADGGKEKPFSDISDKESVREHSNERSKEQPKIGKSKERAKSHDYEHGRRNHSRESYDCEKQSKSREKNKDRNKESKECVKNRHHSSSSSNSLPRTERKRKDRREMSSSPTKHRKSSKSSVFSSSKKKMKLKIRSDHHKASGRVTPTSSSDERDLATPRSKILSKSINSFDKSSLSPITKSNTPPKPEDKSKSKSVNSPLKFKQISTSINAKPKVKSINRNLPFHPKKKLNHFKENNYLNKRPNNLLMPERIPNYPYFGPFDETGIQDSNSIYSIGQLPPPQDLFCNQTLVPEYFYPPNMYPQHDPYPLQHSLMATAPVSYPIPLIQDTSQLHQMQASASSMAAQTQHLQHAMYNNTNNNNNNNSNNNNNNNINNNLALMPLEPSHHQEVSINLEQEQQQQISPNQISDISKTIDSYTSEPPPPGVAPPLPPNQPQDRTPPPPPPLPTELQNALAADPTLSVIKQSIPTLITPPPTATPEHSITTNTCQQTLLPTSITNSISTQLPLPQTKPNSLDALLQSFQVIHSYLTPENTTQQLLFQLLLQSILQHTQQLQQLLLQQTVTADQSLMSTSALLNLLCPQQNNMQDMKNKVIAMLAGQNISYENPYSLLASPTLSLLLQQQQQQQTQSLQQSIQPQQQISQPQPQTQPQPQPQLQPEPEPETQLTELSPTTHTESDPPPPPPPQQLPPNWREAHDLNGKPYYYHTVTKETQWERPEDTSAFYCSPDRSLSVITTDNSSTQSQKRQAQNFAPVTDPITPPSEDMSPFDLETRDNSLEVRPGYRIISSHDSFEGRREKFKQHVGKHVTNILSQFRKPDCRYGKISNTEDFKYLARKLTHTIIDKEMTRKGSESEVLFTEGVKNKATEYIKIYMKKFGSAYKPINVSIS